MNRDFFEGKWNQIKGKIKEKWGRLTKDEIIAINGKRQQLLGKLQSRYGYTKEQAIKELNKFESSYEKEKGSSVLKEHKPSMMLREESSPKIVDRDTFESHRFDSVEMEKKNKPARQEMKHRIQEGMKQPIKKKTDKPVHKLNKNMFNKHGESSSHEEDDNFPKRKAQ